MGGSQRGFLLLILFTQIAPHARQRPFFACRKRQVLHFPSCLFGPRRAETKRQKPRSAAVLGHCCLFALRLPLPAHQQHQISSKCREEQREQGGAAVKERQQEEGEAAGRRRGSSRGRGSRGSRGSSSRGRGSRGSSSRGSRGRGSSSRGSRGRGSSSDRNAPAASSHRTQGQLQQSSSQTS